MTAIGRRARAGLIRRRAARSGPDLAIACACTVAAGVGFALLGEQLVATLDCLRLQLPWSPAETSESCHREATDTAGWREPGPLAQQAEASLHAFAHEADGLPLATGEPGIGETNEGFLEAWNAPPQNEGAPGKPVHVAGAMAFSYLFWKDPDKTAQKVLERQARWAKATGAGLGTLLKPRPNGLPEKPLDELLALLPGDRNLWQDALRYGVDRSLAAALQASAEKDFKPDQYVGLAFTEALAARVEEKGGYLTPGEFTRMVRRYEHVVLCRPNATGPGCGFVALDGEPLAVLDGHLEYAIARTQFHPGGAYRLSLALDGTRQIESAQAWLPPLALPVDDRGWVGGVADAAQRAVDAVRQLADPGVAAVAPLVLLGHPGEDELSRAYLDYAAGAAARLEARRQAGLGPYLELVQVPFHPDYYWQGFWQQPGVEKWADGTYYTMLLAPPVRVAIRGGGGGSGTAFAVTGKASNNALAGFHASAQVVAKPGVQSTALFAPDEEGLGDITWHPEKDAPDKGTNNPATDPGAAHNKPVKGGPDHDPGFRVGYAQSADGHWVIALFRETENGPIVELVQGQDGELVPVEGLPASALDVRTAHQIVAAADGGAGNSGGPRGTIEAEREAFFEDLSDSLRRIFTGRGLAELGDANELVARARQTGDDRTIGLLGVLWRFLHQGGGVNPRTRVELANLIRKWGDRDIATALRLIHNTAHVDPGGALPTARAIYQVFGAEVFGEETPPDWIATDLHETVTADTNVEETVARLVAQAEQQLDEILPDLPERRDEMIRRHLGIALEMVPTPPPESPEYAVYIELAQRLDQEGAVLFARAREDLHRHARVTFVFEAAQRFAADPSGTVSQFMSDTLGEDAPPEEQDALVFSLANFIDPSRPEAAEVVRLGEQFAPRKSWVPVYRERVAEIALRRERETEQARAQEEAAQAEQALQEQLDQVVAGTIPLEHALQTLFGTRPRQSQRRRVVRELLARTNQEPGHPIAGEVLELARQAGLTGGQEQAFWHAYRRSYTDAQASAQGRDPEAERQERRQQQANRKDRQQATRDYAAWARRNSDRFGLGTSGEMLADALAGQNVSKGLATALYNDHTREVGVSGWLNGAVYNYLRITEELGDTPVSLSDVFRAIGPEGFDHEFFARVEVYERIVAVFGQNFAGRELLGAPTTPVQDAMLAPLGQVAAEDMQQVLRREVAVRLEQHRIFTFGPHGNRDQAVDALLELPDHILQRFMQTGSDVPGWDVPVTRFLGIDPRNRLYGQWNLIFPADLPNDPQAYVERLEALGGG